MKILELEIKEAIEKSLPKQVGEVLSQRLKEASVIEDKYETLKDSYNSLVQENKHLKTKEAEAAMLEIKEASLNAKELQLKELERSLEIKDLKNQLEVANSKTEFTEKVALGLVRNINYRRTIFDNVSEPGGTDQYGNTMYINKSQNLQEEVRAE